MNISGNHSALALTYAHAMLDLAGDRAEEIGAELSGLAEVLEQTPSFVTYLADPGIGDIERTATLERTFKGKIDDLVWRFLGVLNNKHRLGALPQIIAAYQDLLDEKLGKVEVDLTVAEALSPEQLAAAQQQISASLGKEAVIHMYVNDAIIGGAVMRVGDRLIDASVRHQLHAMKQRLLASVPA